MLRAGLELLARTARVAAALGIVAVLVLTYWAPLAPEDTICTR